MLVGCVRGLLSQWKTGHGIQVSQRIFEEESQRRVGKAESENKVLKYKVVPPGVTSVGIDRTRVKYEM